MCRHTTEEKCPTVVALVWEIRICVLETQILRSVWRERDGRVQRSVCKKRGI